MFLLKKIVSRFLFPLPLSLEFLILGLFLLWFTRRQRAGKALVTCGVVLLLGFSNIVIQTFSCVLWNTAIPALDVTHMAVGASPICFHRGFGRIGRTMTLMFPSPAIFRRS